MEDPRMPASGIDFISLQVRDLQASAEFYEQRIGLVRSPAGPPHAVVFATEPFAFAVRDLAPGVSLDGQQPGLGVALWFLADDVQAIHDRLVDTGTMIDVPPFEGPFGLTFTFVDLDGYRITLHSRGA
jgi:predicted enzyme related to lactoylglutathione lyase